MVSCGHHVTPQYLADYDQWLVQFRTSVFQGPPQPGLTMETIQSMLATTLDVPWQFVQQAKMRSDTNHVPLHGMPDGRAIPRRRLVHGKRGRPRVKPAIALDLVATSPYAIRRYDHRDEASSPGKLVLCHTSFNGRTFWYRKDCCHIMHSSRSSGETRWLLRAMGCVAKSGYHLGSRTRTPSNRSSLDWNQHPIASATTPGNTLCITLTVADGNHVSAITTILKLLRVRNSIIPQFRHENGIAFLGPLILFSHDTVDEDVAAFIRATLDVTLDWPENLRHKVMACVKCETLACSNIVYIGLDKLWQCFEERSCPLVRWNCQHEPAILLAAEASRLTRITPIYSIIPEAISLDLAVASRVQMNFDICMQIITRALAFPTTYIPRQLENQRWGIGWMRFSQAKHAKGLNPDLVCTSMIRLLNGFEAIEHQQKSKFDHIVIMPSLALSIQLGPPTETRDVLLFRTRYSKFGGNAMRL